MAEAGVPTQLAQWFARLFGPTLVPESARTQERFQIVVCALVFAVGLVLPDDLLSRSQALRTFCDAIASVVPQIDRVTRLGIRPDANRLYYSLLWIPAIPFFLVGYLSARASFTRGLAKPPSLAMTILILLGFLFGMAFCMFLWYGVGTIRASDWKTRALFSLPVLREVFAMILVFGFWVCLAGVLIGVEQMPKLLKERG